MPPKKGVKEHRVEEYAGGDFESEMTTSSPRSEASLDSASSMSLSAVMLEKILANSQASLEASQKAMGEQQKASQKAMEEQQKLLIADNHAAMTALIAAIPSGGAAHVVATPKVPRLEVPKWKEGEAPMEYFLKYEKAQSHNEVPKVKWGVLLQVFLSGSAQAAYTQIDPGLVNDYDLVKSTMLKALRDTPEQADRNWWSIARKQGETMSAFQIRLKGVATRRFQGCETREALFEKVVLSRLLYLLPADQYNLVTMRHPESAAAVADIVDDLECRAEFARMHLSGSRQNQGGQPYYRKDNYHRNNRGYRGGGQQGGNDSTGSSTPPPSSPSVVVGSSETAERSKVGGNNSNPTQAGNKGSSSNPLTEENQ